MAGSIAQGRARRRRRCVAPRSRAACSTAAEGTIYEKIAINPVPEADARRGPGGGHGAGAGSAGPSRPPELVVLPTAGARYVLAYRVRVFNGSRTRRALPRRVDAAPSCSARRRRTATASRTLIVCSRPSAECVDVSVAAAAGDDGARQRQRKPQPAQPLRVKRSAALGPGVPGRRATMVARVRRRPSTSTATRLAVASAAGPRRPAATRARRATGGAARGPSRRARRRTTIPTDAARVAAAERTASATTGDERDCAGLGRRVLQTRPVAHLARQLLQPLARPQRAAERRPAGRGRRGRPAAAGCRSRPSAACATRARPGRPGTRRGKAWGMLTGFRLQATNGFEGFQPGPISCSAVAGHGVQRRWLYTRVLTDPGAGGCGRRMSAPDRPRRRIPAGRPLERRMSAPLPFATPHTARPHLNYQQDRCPW